MRVSFRGARNFPPELSNNFFFVAPIKTEKFSKSLSGFSTTFRLFPALESSSSMSFWSNKTEDGNKQFPTCSVRYVLSVESMIRWRWIALVGVFNLRRGRWWSSDTWNQVLLLSPLHTFRLVLPCFHSAVVPRVPDEIGVGRVPVDDVVVVGWFRGWCDAPFADGKALLPSPPQVVGQTGSSPSGLPPFDGVGFAVLLRCTLGISVVHSSMDGWVRVSRPGWRRAGLLSLPVGWMATDSPERCNELAFNFSVQIKEGRKQGVCLFKPTELCRLAERRAGRKFGC